MQQKEERLNGLVIFWLWTGFENVVKGKVKGMIEVMGRRGSRRKKFLDG
jgi:hypothetical protein